MKKTYILAAVAVLFWSTVATVTKLLLNDYNPFQVLWISSFFAAVALLGANIVRGTIKELKTYRLKDYLITILIGLPGTFFYYVFYYGGAAKMAQASQAFIVNYLWPMMCVVWACIILKEKLTAKKALAIGLSFIGVVVVVWKDLFPVDTNTLLGAGLCAMGAVSYGLFTALNQKWHYNKQLSMMLNYTITFVLTTIINAVRDDLFIPTATQTLGFAWNGALTMALANTAWVMALECGQTAKVSNLAYITPFLSLVWTWLVLNESLDPAFVIGLSIIVIGILIQYKRETPRLRT